MPPCKAALGTLVTTHGAVGAAALAGSSFAGTSAGAVWGPFPAEVRLEVQSKRQKSHSGWLEAWWSWLHFLHSALWGADFLNLEKSNLLFFLLACTFCVLRNIRLSQYHWQIIISTDSCNNNSYLCALLQYDLDTISIFLKCLIEFSSETIWAWSFLCEKLLKNYY